MAMDHDIDIKALRETVGWSQETLAIFLGVDRSSVSHMENGRPARGPVIRLLKSLAVAVANGTADQLRPAPSEQAA